MRPALASLLVLAFAPAAAAQVRADPAADIPLTLASGAVWLLVPMHAGGPFPYDPGAAPTGIDSWAPLHENQGANTASEIVAWTATVGGLGGAALAGVSQKEVAGHLLLEAEALAITGAATSITKTAVDRARPYAYGQHAVNTAADQASFFSGHTSNVAAATFCLARMLDLDGDLGPGGRWVAYGGAAVLTAAVGTLRVAAGRHFPTDVIAGALVGGGIGWLVPQLHHTGVSVGASGSSVSLAFRF